MNLSIGRRVWMLLLAGAVALAALGSFVWDAATREVPGQPGLAAAAPAPNAILAAAPERIELTFAEAVDPQTVNVRLLQAGGTEVPLAIEPGQDPASHVVARASRPLDGRFTVVWSARTAADETLLAGAYPFRGGFYENPGAAGVASEWPRAWATLLRWLVFLGASIATGGFGWVLLPASGVSSRVPLSLARGGVMTASAMVALLATLLAPIMQWRLDPPPVSSLLGTFRALPPGWWLLCLALTALVLLCLGMLASQRTSTRLPRRFDWIGLGVGLAALAGLGLTSRAAGAADPAVLVLETAHLWSTALWFSGLLYLVAAWRDFGTDVARFRTVRWVGGVLVALSVVTGVVRASLVVPEFAEALGTRFGQVLAGKSILVAVILGLGLLTLVVPRRSNANRASSSLGLQAGFAFGVALLAAALALMATPGTIARQTLAGISLADAVALDGAAFGVERGLVNLLLQPGNDGSHTLVVRLTGADGTPLTADPVPAVGATWTRLMSAEGPEEGLAEGSEILADLDSDASGAIFTGAVSLPEEGWWRAVVDVTPAGGIATRTRFWLVLPDPNIAGHGPDPLTNPEAQALYEQGLASVASLRSVRVSRTLNDGAGALVRSRSAVSTGGPDRPPAYREVTIDATGAQTSEQRIIGERRWTWAPGTGWTVADPIPLPLPSDWRETYLGATGFQMGPRETIDGELSQIITFWLPPGENRSQRPAWVAWWVGLASGEVRREVAVSTRHYQVSDFSDFDAPFQIAPPPGLAPATPATPEATPGASPLATPAATSSS